MLSFDWLLTCVVGVTVGGRGGAGGLVAEAGQGLLAASCHAYHLQIKAGKLMIIFAYKRGLRACLNLTSIVS